MKIEKITPMIGAEITGIDLSKPLQGSDYDDLYNVLMDHQVIFLRDQELTHQGHLDLARSFGEPEPPHPVYPSVEGYENIMVLANGPDNPPDTDGWHTDVTFRPNPPFSSILYSRKIPPVGGDTLWLSMTAAFNDLPDGMKSDLRGLKAVHDMGDFRNNFTVDKPAGKAEELISAHQRFGSAIHDVVKTHPVTGKEFLFVNQGFTQHIVGMVARDSDRLLRYLFDHIDQPEYQVRFKWTQNTIAMWDNRCTQHYATADYLPHERVMHRITVTNDRRVDTSKVRTLKTG